MTNSTVEIASLLFNFGGTEGADTKHSALFLKAWQLLLIALHFISEAKIKIFEQKVVLRPLLINAQMVAKGNKFSRKAWILEHPVTTSQYVSFRTGGASAGTCTFMYYHVSYSGL